MIARRGAGRLVLLMAVGVLVACSRETDLTLFQDVTAASGLPPGAGMTHGAAWGDFDGDGRPDVYVTNHLNAAQLFRNRGEARFEDVTARHFAPADLVRDKHGAAWADFDRDGRLDLVQLTGAVRGLGAEGKHLFRNTGEGFVDVAEALGVLNLQARTRMPLWLDLDGDGRLDLLHGAEARFDNQTPTMVFRQAAGHFVPADETLPFAARSVPFCVLSQLSGDHRNELVCRLMEQHKALQVFDLSVSPARPLGLLPQTAFEDIATADFDNDGRVDVFMARKTPPAAVAVGRPSADRLVASVATDRSKAGEAMGFGFRAPGPLQVKVAGANPAYPLQAQHVLVGAEAAHPPSLAFEVESAAGAIAGVAPGSRTAVHVGFEAPDRWDVRVTAPTEALQAGRPRVQEVQVAVTAAGPIDDPKIVGDTRSEDAPFRLFMNRGAELVEESDRRGVNQRSVAGMSVVTGDFDNDMDLDLYVLASGDIGQQQNLLLLNDGTGYFSLVKDAGGAAGSASGVGDSVTTADVDGDGFLDLLLTNGGSMGRSLGLPSDGGGYQLFRNLGNGNRWLAIDLEGTQSNRDGIGAIVRVTANGVTQTRVQDGGVHHRGQNHARLHFGLGASTQIEKIEVAWPSGAAQSVRGVEPNRVLRITEPAAAR